MTHDQLVEQVSEKNIVLVAASHIQSLVLKPAESSIVSEDCQRMYNSILRSRSQGISQVRLSDEVNIAPKTVFHHLKQLIIAGLVFKYPAYYTDAAGKLYASNQCVSTRFLDKCPGYQEYQRKIEFPDTYEINEGSTHSIPYNAFKTKIMSMLDSAEHNSLFVYDILVALGFNLDDRQSRKAFYRVIERLEKEGYTERIVVERPETELTSTLTAQNVVVRKLRDLEEPDIIAAGQFSRPSEYLATQRETDPDRDIVLSPGAIRLNMTFENQIIDLIRQTGERGATNAMLRKSLNHVPNKMIHRLLGLIEKLEGSPVTSVMEIFGRERRIRYYATNEIEYPVPSLPASALDVNYSNDIALQGVLKATGPIKAKGRPRKNPEGPVAPAVPKKKGRPLKVVPIDSPSSSSPAVVGCESSGVVVKKRGRPPKSVHTDREPSSPIAIGEGEPPLVPKKRGRPPKAAPAGNDSSVPTPEEARTGISADPDSAPKKRGRPRKDLAVVEVPSSLFQDDESPSTTPMAVDVAMEIVSDIPVGSSRSPIEEQVPVRRSPSPKGKRLAVTSPIEKHVPARRSISPKGKGRVVQPIQITPERVSYPLVESSPRKSARNSILLPRVSDMEEDAPGPSKIALRAPRSLQLVKPTSSSLQLAKPMSRRRALSDDDEDVFTPDVSVQSESSQSEGDSSSGSSEDDTPAKSQKSLSVRAARGQDKRRHPQNRPASESARTSQKAFVPKKLQSTRGDLLIDLLEIEKIAQSTDVYVRFLDYLVERKETNAMAGYRMDHPSFKRLVNQLQGEHRLHCLTTAVQGINGIIKSRKVLIHGSIDPEGEQVKTFLENLQRQSLVGSAKAKTQKQKVDLVVERQRDYVLTPRAPAKPKEAGTSSENVQSAVDCGYEFAKIKRARLLYDWMVRICDSDRTLKSIQFFTQLPLRLAFKVIGIFSVSKELEDLAHSSAIVLDTPVGDLHQETRTLLMQNTSHRYRKQVAQCLAILYDLGMVSFPDQDQLDEASLARKLPDHVLVEGSAKSYTYTSGPPKLQKSVPMDTPEAIESHWSQLETRFLSDSSFLLSQKRRGKTTPANSDAEDEDGADILQGSTGYEIEPRFKYLFISGYLSLNIRNWSNSSRFTESDRAILMERINKEHMTTPYNDTDLCRSLATQLDIRLDMIKRFYLDFENSFKEQSQKRAKTVMQTGFEGRTTVRAQGSASQAVPMEVDEPTREPFVLRSKTAQKSLAPTYKYSDRQKVIPFGSRAPKTIWTDELTEYFQFNISYLVRSLIVLQAIMNRNFLWKMIEDLTDSAKNSARNHFNKLYKRFNEFKSRVESLRRQWPLVYARGIDEEAFEEYGDSISAAEVSQMVEFFKTCELDVEDITRIEDDLKEVTLISDEDFEKMATVPALLPPKELYLDEKLSSRKLHSITQKANLLRSSLYSVRGSVSTDFEVVDRESQLTEMLKIVIRMILLTPENLYNADLALKLVQSLPKQIYVKATHQLIEEGALSKIHTDTDPSARRIPGRGVSISDRFRQLIKGVLPVTLFDEAQAFQTKMSEPPLLLDNALDGGSVAVLFDELTMDKSRLVVELNNSVNVDSPFENLPIRVIPKDIPHSKRGSEGDTFGSKRVRKDRSPSKSPVRATALEASIFEMVQEAGIQGIMFDALFDRIKSLHSNLSRNDVSNALIRLDTQILKTGYKAPTLVSKQFASDWRILNVLDENETITPRTWIDMFGNVIDSLLMQFSRLVYGQVLFHPGVTEARLHSLIGQTLSKMELHQLLESLVSKCILRRVCHVAPPRVSLFEEPAMLQDADVLMDKKISCYWVVKGSILKV